MPPLQLIPWTSWAQWHNWTPACISDTWGVSSQVPWAMGCLQLRALPKQGVQGCPWAFPCRLCVCSPSSVPLDQQGRAESAFHRSPDTTHSRPGHGVPKMCFAGQFLLRQLGAGLSVCSFHRNLVVFNYLLPISLLILQLGSLNVSVAINDYISVYSLTSVCCQ